MVYYHQYSGSLIKNLVWREIEENDDAESRLRRKFKPRFARKLVLVVYTK